ncbi:hypothetical protein HN51_024655 [Arachis hypogaea]
MVADQKINFKMYKWREERDFKEKAKEKKDGKKRRISICNGETWDAENLTDELWFQLNTLTATPTKLGIALRSLLSWHLHCLFSSPEKVVNDQRYDEFASDVEKVYRILRKYHYRIPKLELALKESGIIVRPGLTERILNRCGNAGNLAYRFYAWASKQSNYQHSQEVYKVIIKVLGKMQQFRAVWALIDEMRQENPMLISPKMFIILMRKFASARMVQKAIEVLDEIPNYRCEFDEYVFGCLLDALCKNGSIKEVVSLFKDMRYRFPPTIKHFTSLLYSWCREGKLMEAKHVLVQMNNAGIEPDIVVYNNLLSGYALAAKMGDAYDLLKEMRMIGCGPNATLYRILI